MRVIDLAWPLFPVVDLCLLGSEVWFLCIVRGQYCSIEATDVIPVIVTIIGVAEGTLAVAAIVKQ